MDSIKRVVKRRPITPKRHMRVLLLAVVGGIIFGIIGMHSLSQDHTAQSPSAHSAEATQPTQTGGMAAATMGGDSQHGEDPSVPDDHCGTLALCLAAIAGGALLLLAALVANRRRPTTHLKRASITVRALVHSVFKPPPDLISLSILRC